jgi:hypothetical protein
MLAAGETYVPHTGSFLSSPPERTDDGWLGALRGDSVERKPSVTLLRSALTNQKRRTGRTTNRKRRRIMESGREAMLPPRTG